MLQATPIKHPRKKATMTFSWPAGLAVGAVGAISRQAVELATDPTTAGTPAVLSHPLAEYLTQLGVTGACIVIAAYMLRRSDQRDAKAAAKEAVAQDARIKLLEAERDLERRRADEAEGRAREAHERLLRAFKDDAH